MKKGNLNFVSKLYGIVNDKKNKDVISWNRNYNGFIIHDFEKFCYHLLPITFNTKVFASFNRQLNIYNFTKQSSSHNKYEYSNPFFIKDQMNLIETIKRKKTKSLSLSYRKLKNTIREMIKTIENLHNRIELLEGKHDFLEYCYSDLSKKNSILERELFIVNEKQKRIEKLFFSIINHISPMFKYLENIFNYSLKFNTSNCIWLKEAFIQIINNAIICYTFENLNNDSINIKEEDDIDLENNPEYLLTNVDSNTMSNSEEGANNVSFLKNKTCKDTE